MPTHVYPEPEQSLGDLLAELLGHADDPHHVTVSHDDHSHAVVEDYVADRYTASAPLVDDDDNPATPPRRRGRPRKATAQPAAEPEDQEE